MYSPRLAGMLALLAAVTGLSAACQAQDSAVGYPDRYGFGEALPGNGMDVALTAIPPDGSGLPAGSGTFAAGRALYESMCSACHGVALEGTALGLPLVGGRGSLDTDRPLKTVESFWPYAPPVFSYIRNAMPPTAPGSLADSDVYSLMAFILGSAGIIAEDAVMDRESLPRVSMPNRDGFIPDPRPDVAAQPAVEIK